MRGELHLKQRLTHNLHAKQRRVKTLSGMFGSPSGSWLAEKFFCFFFHLVQTRKTDLRCLKRNGGNALNERFVQLNRLSGQTHGSHSVPADVQTGWSRPGDVQRGPK